VGTGSKLRAGQSKGIDWFCAALPQSCNSRERQRLPPPPVLMNSEHLGSLKVAPLIFPSVFR